MHWGTISQTASGCLRDRFVLERRVLSIGRLAQMIEPVHARQLDHLGQALKAYAVMIDRYSGSCGRRECRSSLTP
nr:MAG TPA: hypothetical protein [Caudoviricetes sp.]